MNRRKPYNKGQWQVSRERFHIDDFEPPAPDAGAMAVKADVSITKPKGLPPESLLWATPEGNLIGEDPRQTKLDLKAVAPDPVRELKAVQ